MTPAIVPTARTDLKGTATSGFHAWAGCALLGGNPRLQLLGPVADDIDVLNITGLFFLDHQKPLSL